MRMKKTNERGITLISLVITIILLLILAMVAISLAVDSDGLFSKAGDAANKWNTSVSQEQILLNELLNYDSPVSKYVTEEVTDRTAPIPKGYVASQIPGEDTIADGLVIYEGTEEVKGIKGSTEHENAMTTRNQYVWIPVDDINDMVMCKSNAEGSICSLEQEENGDLKCTTHNSNDLAGRLYTAEEKYTETTDADGNEIYFYECDLDFIQTNQTYDANSGYREPAVVKNDGATDDFHGLGTASAFLEQLQGDFDNMVKSVAKYGGFYISRYEIGANGTSKKGQTVLRNASPTNWYTMNNLLRKTGENTFTQMIWGSQYDQVIKFIGDEAETFHLDRHFTEPTISGNNPLDEMSNIFDLEGNYEEWTAETWGNKWRTNRGCAIYAGAWILRVS